MIGGIVGNIIGSKNHNIKFELEKNTDGFTGDIILMLAIAKSVGKYTTYYDLERDLTEYTILNIIKLCRKYPNIGYGSKFINWLCSEEHKPYNSYGNGAALRAIPCGYIAITLEDAIKLSTIVTSITHNHPESISASNAIAACIFLLRTGKSKEEVKRYVNTNYKKIDFTIKDLVGNYKFDLSCQGSVPQAFEAFFESNTFESAINNAISIGGDVDTITAIVGSLAEACYGIPKEMEEIGLSCLTDDLKIIYDRFIKDIAHNSKYINCEVKNPEISELFKKFWVTCNDESYDNYEFMINALNDVYINDEKDIINFETSIIDSNKEELRLFVLKFYNYLLRYKIYINSTLDNYRLYKSDNTARKIDILKMIQKNVTRAELIRRYNMDAKSIKNDINSLRLGTKILGTKVKIDIDEYKDGKNIVYSCKNKANPIFLILNSIEVFDLTNVIEDSLRKDKILDYDNSAIKKIVNNIKSQLSDFTKEELNINDNFNNNFNPYFNIESRMFDYGVGKIEYLIKNKVKCIFYLYGEIYKGIFTLDGISIETENGFKNIPIPHEQVIYKEI